MSHTADSSAHQHISRSSLPPSPSSLCRLRNCKELRGNCQQERRERFWQAVNSVSATCTNTSSQKEHLRDHFQLASANLFTVSSEERLPLSQPFLYLGLFYFILCHKQVNLFTSTHELKHYVFVYSDKLWTIFVKLTPESLLN